MSDSESLNHAYVLGCRRTLSLEAEGRTLSSIMVYGNADKHQGLI